MVTEKPVILIIPGAWHTPGHYGKLIKSLEEVGYEVHCPHLPSVTMVRPPTASLPADSQHIRSYTENLIDSGRQIIALMHSYGGLVGTGALHDLGLESRLKKGLFGGVSHLVFMCAYALPEACSMQAKAKSLGRGGKLQANFIIHDDKTIVLRDPRMIVGEYDDEEEMEEYLSTLQFWNAQIAFEEVSHAAWRDIPTSYIHTRFDQSILYDTQQTMVDFMREEGRDVQTYVLETGHCPNLTAPAGIVDIINKVAA